MSDNKHELHGEMMVEANTITGNEFIHEVDFMFKIDGFILDKDKCFDKDSFHQAAFMIINGVKVPCTIKSWKWEARYVN